MCLASMHQMPMILCEITQSIMSYFYMKLKYTKSFIYIMNDLDLKQLQQNLQTSSSKSVVGVSMLWRFSQTCVVSLNIKGTLWPWALKTLLGAMSSFEGMGECVLFNAKGVLQCWFLKVTNNYITEFEIVTQCQWFWFSKKNHWE